jgi:hypothetical protein
MGAIPTGQNQGLHHILGFKTSTALQVFPEPVFIFSLCQKSLALIIYCIFQIIPNSTRGMRIKN